MVTIFPISDIHAGFVSQNNDFSWFKEESIKDYLGILKDVDILVAAGDLGEGLEGILVLKAIMQSFPHLEIVYVPGNHEYYGQNIDLLNEKLAYLGQVYEHLHILDNTYLFKHTVKGIDFIGATLWTDFCKQNENIMNYAQSHMNDYKYIRSNGAFKAVTTSRILQEHYTHKKKIFRYLEKSENPCVVVTHHVPHMPTNFITDNLTYAFNSDLTEDLNLCTHLPKYWICGHSHRSHLYTGEYTNGKVEFISNQVGYPFEGTTGFSPYCTVEV